LPLRRARDLRVGAAPVSAARISYAGELGWELSTDPNWAVEVWDRLRAVDPAMAPEQFGYRALDALRMEKGYRYYSVDMTMLDTPDEAGLGAFVGLGKGAFIGRDAVRAVRERDLPAAQRRRLGTMLIGDHAGYLPVYGGEALRLDGRVIGRLRSVAFGPTVERTIGYAYVPADLVQGAALSVDVFDRAVPAVLAADVLHDPAGTRLRG
jgi:glycine cleavage system aminomethyltransferase T